MRHSKQTTTVGPGTKFSRRQVLRLASSIGVVSPFWSAPFSAARAQEPKKGGTLRVGVSGGDTADSLDVRTYNGSVMVYVSSAIFDGLVEIDEEGRVQPTLLTSLEPNRNATEWVCNVRKGVSFSNGKRLDADDVIYSINLHRGAGATSGAAGLLKAVTDVVKMSADQIKIVLEAPDADLPYVLSDYHVLIVPNGHLDWARPVGTGGYVLERFEPGVRAVLRNRGEYWRPDRCLLEAADLLVINDDSARMEALLDGKLDATHRVTASSVDQINATGKFELAQASAGYHFVMAMRTDVAPFDNNDARLALKYGINRAKLVEKHFGSYGRVGNDHPIPESDPYFNTELPQTSYDPDRARFHARKAGLSQRSITLSASDAAFGGAIEMATSFQATAAAAGINMRVNREPHDGFWDRVWLHAPFVTSTWGGRPAATQMLAVAYQSAAPWNETKWAAPGFDKLLADAKATTDETKRKAYIWEMQRMLHEEGGALIPVFRDWLDVHHVNVKDVRPYHRYDLCNGRVVQTAWIDA